MTFKKEKAKRRIMLCHNDVSICHWFLIMMSSFDRKWDDKKCGVLKFNILTSFIVTNFFFIKGKSGWKTYISIKYKVCSISFVLIINWCVEFGHLLACGGAEVFHRIFNANRQVCVPSAVSLRAMLDDFDVLPLSSLQTHSVRRRDVQTQTHVEKLISFSALQR